MNGPWVIFWFFLGIYCSLNIVVYSFTLCSCVTLPLVWTNLDESWGLEKVFFWKAIFSKLNQFNHTKIWFLWFYLVEVPWSCCWLVGIVCGDVHSRVLHSVSAGMKSSWGRYWQALPKFCCEHPCPDSWCWAAICWRWVGSSFLWNAGDLDWSLWPSA